MDETDNEELDMEPELPQLPVSAPGDQFPALEGDVQGEIDQRSPEHGEPGRFTRTFQIARLGIGADHPMHTDNARALLQDATQRGLHPHGDVFLVDAVEHDAPRSRYTDLTYAVDVVPASIDTDSANVVTPSDINAARDEVA